VIRAVLFDLDDTLIPEAASWVRAFDSACRPDTNRLGVDLAKLRLGVFESARELWEASRVNDYCRRLGLGSPSSLLSSFPGDTPEAKFLRDWGPVYRHEAWTAGLGRVGVSDASLVPKLSETFRESFRSLHVPYDDVRQALNQLGRRRVAVISNGFADLQREKLGKAQLDTWFEPILISAEVGYGKPDPRIFELALRLLELQPSECLMVGDGLEKDVQGALEVGIRAVWLDRENSHEHSAWPGPRIRSLSEVPGHLT
jgi:putative hydrolase of the HAD superfamily